MKPENSDNNLIFVALTLEVTEKKLSANYHHHFSEFLLLFLYLIYTFSQSRTFFFYLESTALSHLAHKTLISIY